MISFEILCLLFFAEFFVTFCAIIYTIWSRSRKFLGIVSIFIFGWVLTSYYLIEKLTAIPSVSSFSTNENNILEANNPIRVVFDFPVNFSKLSIHSFPNDDLKIDFKGYLRNSIPVGREIFIYSNVTLPPGENVMVYLSNISGPFNTQYGGEKLFELKTENPTVLSVSPELSNNIATDQSFLVHFNIPIGFENEWNVESEPKHSFLVEQVDQHTLKIMPAALLQQGTKYNLSLWQKGVVRNKNSGEILSTTQPRTVYSIIFTTIKPAFISEFTPEGENIELSTIPSFQFDQPMDIDSVTHSLTFEPSILFTPHWDSSNSSLELIHSPFEADQLYTITMKKGMKTKSGGTLEKDQKFQFRTIGPFQITSSNPSSNTNNISPNSSLSLEFNQEISDEIEKQITVNPQIQAVYKVEKNKLAIIPEKPLLFNTKYIITLPEGVAGKAGLESKSTQLISFITSPEQVELNVPFYKQESAFTCNIAAARMLLAYKGVMVSEKTLIDHIGNGGKRGSGNPYKGYIDDYGTYWDAIERGVAFYRPFRRITSGKIEDIIKEIKSGSPVMIWGQNGWSDPHDLSWTTPDGVFIKAINGMHSSVVRGFRGPEENPTHILINDPWRGQYAVETAEFLRRWGFLSVALVID